MNIPLAIETCLRDWVIGSKHPIDPKQFKHLLRLTKPAPFNRISPLDGRSSVLRTCLEDVGAVVVKHYVRGGMMHWLMKDRYIRTGITRARAEFEMLLKAGRIGVHVPEPVFYFQKGARIYRCWLVTKEIPAKGSVARISFDAPGCIDGMMDGIRHQVRKMIANGLYHVDFHPGNVLVDQHGIIYILDFDKAFLTSMPSKTLAEKYLSRWNRAVLKHGLPKKLLQKSFN